MKLTIEDQLAIEFLNKNYPFRDLRYKTNDRVKISKQYPKHFVALLAKQLNCVQKIFHGKGYNSYYYYAPIGVCEKWDEIGKAMIDKKKLESETPKAIETPKRKTVKI